MEIIATNPERRDPGFSENKLDLGLGRVDNISSTDLLNIIVKSAKIIANEKAIGESIQSVGEGFFPIFETAEGSSTCSLEVGFFDTLNNELSSFDITFSYFDDEISYLLNVAPDSYRIEEMYLRVIKKDNKLIGGIYWESGDLFNPSYNFNKIGVNLIHWTEGSKILDPSTNQISIYNVNNQESGCVLIIDIPLKESSSTIDYAASSFVLYDKDTGKRLIGTDANYTTDQLKNIDAPTINGVPFLLKRGTTVDGKFDARHIIVPAKHEDSHIEKAGGHNWDVLERIRKAGLIQNTEGAEHGIGEMLNIDDLHYGVTRLSGYDKLDTTSISVEELNSWLDSLGYDTDVISVGLFKNFVGYLCRLIDSSYNPKVLDFSLENSAHEFLFMTASGSNGTEITFNTYRRDYSSTGYVNTGIFGSETLLGFIKDDPDGIVETITFSQVNDTQVVANIKISKNNTEDSRSATITFKQLNGTVPTNLPDIIVHIFQEGFITEYGYLCGETESSLTPIFESSGLSIYRDFNQFTTTRIIKPIVTENTELGYRLAENITTTPILDDRAKVWSSLAVSDNLLTVSGLKNESSYKRTASGYLAMYDSSNTVLGRIPVTIIQGSVDGYLELSDHFISVKKSGETVSTTVNSNYAWTIDVNTVPSWITIPGFSGSRKAGSSIISFNVAENTGGDRVANIKFINDFGNTDILEITQLGKSEYLDIVGFPDKDIFLSMSPKTTGHYGRNVVNITFDTDKTWVIDYKPSWIGVDYASGPARQGFTIRLTFTGDGYISGTQGDYISLGYFDKNYNAIISLRKIYIDLRSWGPMQNSNYTDSGAGAYLFGPTYSELMQGDTSEIYCIGNLTQLKSNISGTLSSYFDVLAESVISGEPEFEFTDSTWINIEEFPVGVNYPEISFYPDYFKCFKRGIKATKNYGSIHYDYLKNIESPITNRENVDTVTIFEVTKTGFATTYLGVPSSSTQGNSDVAKLCYRRTMKAGISVEALEGGNKDGIVLSGGAQVITLKAKPKYTEDGQQQLVHLFLLNQTLPGWLYFEESLTSQDNIAEIDQFGEKEYRIHILPNRTGEQRTATLQICDRGIADTLINYTITQRSTILTTMKRLVSVVPILSEEIDGPEAKTIEILPLFTWEDEYSINGNEYSTRTYREIPSYSSSTVRIDEGNEWFSIRSSNFKNYLEIYANSENTPRTGQITIIAKDELGNTVTGSLRIYQPSSTVQIQRSVTIQEIKPIDVGENTNNPVPLELYSFGYQITGTKTISYGSEQVTENGILFPETLNDITISCNTSQEFDLSTPLSLIKKDPYGVESVSNFSVNFHGTTASMNLYQELNDIPFELDYSYVQVENSNFIVPLLVTSPDAIISESNNRITVTNLSGEQSELYVQVSPATMEGTTAVLRKSGELKLIPGTNTGSYDRNYGLSLQKPEIIKISTRDNSIVHVLTVVPKPIEGTILVKDNINNYTGINLNANEYSLETVKHGYEIPRALQINGINSNGNFGNVIYTTGGTKELVSTTTNVLPRSIGNPYFYTSKFPVSVVARSLRNGNSLKSYYYAHQEAKTRTSDFNPFDLFVFSPGITKTSDTDLLLARNQNDYTIEFSGVPFGTIISNISVKNNITNYTWGQTRFGEVKPTPVTNHELILYSYNIGANSDIHGSYPEYETQGSYLNIQCKWGGYRDGYNRGQDLYESGENFQIATVTFRFKYYSTDGTETIVEKSLNLNYEGKDIEATLDNPKNGQLVLRSNHRNEIIGIVDPVAGSYWSGANGTTQCPIRFTTEKYWMIYLKEGVGSWIFNGNDYSSSWSDSAGNSGFNSSKTSTSVTVGLRYDNNITDLTEYKGTAVTDNNLARFEILASSRDTSDSTWINKRGPSVYFKIGPALPNFNLLDNINNSKIEDGGNLEFAYIRQPGSYENLMLRACFTLADCPYTLTTSQIQELFGDEFSQTNATTPALTGDTLSHDALNVYPPENWSCKLVYVPSQTPGRSRFYLTYYSVEDDIISLNDSNIDGNPVGDYTIDLKDVYQYPGTAYSMSFSGVVSTSASEISSDESFPGEIVLFENQVDYEHVDPEPEGEELDLVQNTLDKGHYYIELIPDDEEELRGLEGLHYTSQDYQGEDGDRDFDTETVYVLKCQSRYDSLGNLRKFHVRYSGGDTMFYYTYGSSNPSGRPYSYDYDQSAGRIISLQDLSELIPTEGYSYLILWRVFSQQDNEDKGELTVYEEFVKNDWDDPEVIRPNSTTDLTYTFTGNDSYDLSTTEFKVAFAGNQLWTTSNFWIPVKLSYNNGTPIDIIGNDLLNGDYLPPSYGNTATVKIPGYVDKVDPSYAFYIYIRDKVNGELKVIPEIPEYIELGDDLPVDSNTDFMYGDETIGFSNGEHIVNDKDQNVPNWLAGKTTYVLRCQGEGEGYSISDWNTSSEDYLYNYTLATIVQEPEEDEYKPYYDLYNLRYSENPTQGQATRSELLDLITEYDNNHALTIWKPDTESGYKYLLIKKKERKNWYSIENIYPKSTTELTYEFPQNSAGLDMNSYGIYIRFASSNNILLDLSGIPATIVVTKPGGIKNSIRTTNLISVLNNQINSEVWFSGGTTITVDIADYNNVDNVYADQIDTGRFIMYIEEKRH